MPVDLTKRLLRLVKFKRHKSLYVRICEEVFEGHLVLQCSLFKSGSYWNDPDLYLIKCLVCEHQQILDQFKAKEFLKKSLKGENPKLEDPGF